ncbi:DUF3298 and DUF4163 domain-containing protein [Legionella nagasakiensis]|uniref:DUF3298 and DUF4163 domain-containing protein n=1 Tax=Legionella nagasakiensis TaxID=535290 RepID=UPI0010561476|nr:DUF3298 and DUF4163 domain-containing protein [Legionella nagasakiensis]
MQRKFFLVGLLLSLTTHIAFAVPPEAQTIQQETPEYIMNIRYPDEFSSTQVNEIVAAFIKNRKNNFLKMVSKGDNIPASVTSKNSLYIDYKIPYQSHDALSVLFDTSIYHRGAAHPSPALITFNFIHGKQVKLEEMFTPGSDYLNRLAKLCREALLKKKLPTYDLVNEGTKPEKQNFNTWYFSSSGLVIVFNVYQVAPYFVGPQYVELPRSALADALNGKVAQAVWGSQ